MECGHGPVVEAILRGGQAPEPPREPDMLCPTGAKGSHLSEREHVSERVFGAMLLGDLALPFSRVPLTIVRPLVPGANIHAVSKLGRASVECHFPGGLGLSRREELQHTPTGPSQGEEVGLLGPPGPFVRGMGGVGTALAMASEG